MAFLTKNAPVYYDESFVFGKFFEEQKQRLEQVFARLTENGLKLKYSKFRISLRGRNLFKHVVSEKGVEMDMEKVTAIKKLKSAVKLKEMRGVLGSFNFCRKFFVAF